MKIDIVRFGNVIGSSGSVIPLFLEQIAGRRSGDGDPPGDDPLLHAHLGGGLPGPAGRHPRRRRANLHAGHGRAGAIADLARDLIQLSNHTEDEIPIVYTGLRPGEKLYEEVRLQGESIRPTLHPQIVITEQAQPPSYRVAEWLERTEAIPVTSGAAVVAALKDIIPEYTLPPHWATAVAPPSAAPRDSVRAADSEPARAPRGLRSEVPA